MGVNSIQAMQISQLRKIQLDSRRFRDEIVASPYTSVGGYPLYAVTSDGAALCHKCCKTEAAQIGKPSGYSHDQFRLIGLEVNWEDAGLYCDHCGGRIESAYAEHDCD